MKIVPPKFQIFCLEIYIYLETANSVALKNYKKQKLAAKDSFSATTSEPNHQSSCWLCPTVGAEAVNEIPFLHHLRSNPASQSRFASPYKHGNVPSTPLPSLFGPVNPFKTNENS